MKAFTKTGNNISYQISSIIIVPYIIFVNIYVIAIIKNCIRI